MGKPALCLADPERLKSAEQAVGLRDAVAFNHARTNSRDDTREESQNTRPDYSFNVA
jgi:hypothetical protein